jgi:hypothetical protein
MPNAECQVLVLQTPLSRRLGLEYPACVEMGEYSEKRRYPRFVCEGGVEVREEGKRGFWGTMSDISLGGCYVQTFSPMPAGTLILFLIKAHGMEIRGRGKVVAMHPGVGMAIAFVEMTQPDRQRLEHIIGNLTAAEKHQGGDLIITP